MAPSPKQIDLSPDEAGSLIERVRSRSLDEKDWEILIGIIEAVLVLYQTLSRKSHSIQRLLRRIFAVKTESTRNILGAGMSCAEPWKAPPTQHKAEKKRGHGRNGVASYPNAARIPVKHERFKKADPCPLCPKGKLYPMAPPALVVRMMGHAPVEPVVFECDRLRCNLCGKIFTAKIPESAGEEKFDPSARAIMACLKYGSGFPFYRLEGLQKSLKSPLPASTQWDELEKLANRIHPLYPELIRQAARGEAVHNDDTSMRILSLAKAIASEDAQRRGIFTTAVVSVAAGHKVALFSTANRHAGENLGAVLQHRPPDLPPPIQMCDALSRNVPPGMETIFSNCLSHARRNFVDVHSSFPEQCAHLFQSLGKIYHNEAIARAKNLTAGERLEVHQAQSAPVMDELKAWMIDLIDQRQVEPNSGLGKALSYMLKRWDKFTVFLRVPGAPLDNNLCERVLKRAVLHRKNSLFYRTEHGAYVGDLFMSIITTCLLCEADPFDYLVVLQKNAPEVRIHPEQWLPWNYRHQLDAKLS